MEELGNIDIYWHSLDASGRGLAYGGITLIPLCSIPSFIEIIKDGYDLSEFMKLLKKAYKDNRSIIHFGL